MKEQIWTNKKDWLQLVYPYIVDWAIALDYNIPSVSTLNEYVVKFLDCTSYESTYNGKKIQAIGTHYGSLKRIKIASKRDRMEIMSTLIHEFAHAIQLFSLGTKFHMQYATEAETKDHEENKFEDQARDLERRLKRNYSRNSILMEELAEFVFSFEKPKPVPKPESKPKPKKKVFEGFGGSYYRDYRSPDFMWYEKPYTKQWWLRR
jgi:hypothetical protein